nr:nitroreductase family protein [uncultured Roseateles sp.]
MSLKSAAKGLLQCLPKGARLALLEGLYRWRDRRDLRRAYVYDQGVFLRGSGLLRQYSHQASIEAQIIKTYHRLEKGLALAAPRPGFGRDAVDLLLTECETHLRLFGANASLRRALETLDAYIEFNRGQGADVQWLLPRLESLRARLVEAGFGPVGPAEAGTLAVSRESIHRASRLDLSEFFAQRYSVRQFSGEPIAPALFEQAARMAQKTPSVCNRESGTAYVIQDKAKMAKLLSLQNGNRGFGDQAGALLVFTSRLDTFLSVGERYQGWIDGGLFAMSWIYAVHSLGLGSCCLNWSVEPQEDLALKQAAGIPEDELVIMMLVVGHLPEAFKVASSPRRPLDQVLKFL